MQESVTVDHQPTTVSLSIVIPVYNERATLGELLRQVAGVGLPMGVEREIIVVDDGSTDGTPELLAELAGELGLNVVLHESNRGKGAALHTGFAHATGDLVLVQDADLEYDPRDIALLLGPILEGRADVVYGSRFVSGSSRRVLYYWHSVVNRILTTLCNMVANVNLTDMEVCYKLFRREYLERIRLREKRFGFEPEITIKLSRLRPQPRFYEVGISYAGRTYAEGKKIGWRDGLRALWCILRYAVAD